MFIIAQGHTSPLFLSGLSPLVPLLLAIAAPSTFLLLATALTSRGDRSNPTRYSQNSSGALRFIALAALLISLGLLFSNPFLPAPPKPTLTKSANPSQP